MSVSSAAPPRVEPEEEVPEHFSFRQRALLALARTLGPLLVKMIGMTLRYRMSFEPGAIRPHFVPGAIYPFWHRCILPAAYMFRDHGCAVLTSRSADGEYIAAVINRLGFVAVRGSSSRGAVGGMRGLQEAIAAGRVAVFTIDGPRGPRYVAKRGPVLLARLTGSPIIPFYVAVEDPWVLPSWDAFMVPKPFSRGLVRVGAPIYVPSDADEAEMERLHGEMQRGLERVRDEGEAELRRRERA